MKKLFVATVLISTVLISCKKDRTCTCTVTKTGTSTTTAALTYSVPILGNVPVIDTSFTTPVNEIQTYDKTLMDVNKRTAKQNCISYKEPYNDNIINSAPPLQLTTNSKGDRVYKCELK
ncbi:MAG: hypothetical protein V4506_04980 [Bacteroidota bacterium]